MAFIIIQIYIKYIEVVEFCLKFFSNYIERTEMVLKLYFKIDVLAKLYCVK